jgi:uncharacterized integral membrane protein
MGGAVLALIFSFFSFYEYKPKGAQSTRVCHNLNLVPPSARSEVADVCDGVDNSAWHGFFGWFGVLLLLVAAVLVAIAIFAPQVRLPFPVRLASLGVAGLGFVSVLIALFVIPDGDYNGRRIPVNASDTDAGHGFSYWIVLILAAAVAGLCLMRFLQSGEGRGPASGTPQQGYAGPAPGYPPQQQGGYQPEQQQGYAAPPPAGYSAPPPPPPAPPGDAPPPAPH